MKVSYDRAAFLEYSEGMNVIEEIMRCSKDKSSNVYYSCKQQYAVLYTEIEQITKEAFTKLENAESMRRTAEAEFDLAIRLMENAEDGNAQDNAKRQLQHAQEFRTESEAEFEVASANYSNAKAQMERLTEVWNKYQLQLELAEHKVEDDLSDFITVVGNGERDLSDYMRIMDEAQLALYGDNAAVQTNSVGSDSAQNQSVKLTKTTPKGSTFGFKTIKGNIIGFATVGGLSNIVMCMIGNEYSFPNTMAGAAEAYKIAIKSGDSELIARTEDMFFAGGVVQTTEKRDGQQYVADTMAELQMGLPGTIDKEMVMAGAEIRKMRAPREGTRGKWQDSVFFLDDAFVPRKYNPENLTVGEIKEQLSALYGIQVDGIPFAYGVADFSSISVASISTADIVMRKKGMAQGDYDSLEPLARTKLLDEIFTSKRSDNYDVADQIVAERQLPIPGLTPGYTADDLKEWREKGKIKFTWDEQVNGGYNLIPSVIHESIAHTGLVKSTSRAVDYFEKRKNDSSEKYSWDESEAQISISELLK